MKIRIIREVEAQNEAEAEREVKTGTETEGKVSQMPVILTQEAYTAHQQ